MANKNLTDLTARTATADSDLLHINSGGTDYKETKENFVDDLAQRASFNNTSNIKTQAGALSRSNKLYYGICNSYGHQTETGSPINANFYVTVHVNSSASKRVELIVIGASGRRFQAFQNTGTWTEWEELPARSEITSLNNSLTKSSVAFTKHASITGELLQCHKLANVLYISGYFKVSSTVSSGAVLLDIPSISNYVLQYIFIHNASNQVSARLETASNSGHLCIKVGTAISGSEYHYISCAIVL